MTTENTENTPEQELSPEQEALNQRMTQFALQAGQVALQQSALMLANAGGAAGIPLAFEFKTEAPNGKALVYVINADEATVQRVRMVLDAVTKPLEVTASTEVVAEAPVDEPPAGAESQEG